MPLLSIIVTIYKSEKFLKYCCDSLLVQQFSDFEAIFIDDCSPDNSYEVLRPYLDQYQNFIYHRLEKNQGTAVARNTGAEFSSGEYLLLLDPDDTISPNTLKEIAKAIKKNQPDFLQYSKNTYENGKYISSFNLFLGTCKGKRIFETLFVNNTYTSWSAGAKVYKRSLYFRVLELFPKIRLIYTEDFLFNYIASFFAESFVGVPNAKYNYYKHSEGASSHSLNSEERWTTWRDNHTFIFKFLAEFNHKYNIIQQYHKIQNVYYIYFWTVNSYITQQSINNQHKRFAEFCKVIGLDNTLDILSSYYPREQALSLISNTKKNNQSIKTIAIIGEKFCCGEIEKINSLLIPCLQNLGYKIILITEQEPTPQDFVLPKNCTREILREKRYQSITQIIAKYQIDTVILQDYSRQITCWDLLYFSQRQDIFCIYSLYNMPLWSEFESPYEKDIYDAFLNCADFITCSSKSNEFYLREHTNVPVLYVPNLLTFNPELVSQSSLSSSTILVLGQLDNQKKPFFALKAFSMIIKQVPNAHLVFAGSGSYMQELQDLTKKLNLQNHVDFLGSVTNVSELLTQSDILLLSSHFEGYPMEIFEALAHGVPVLCNQMDYLEAKHWNGVEMFEKESLSDCVNKAVKILSDESYRQTLGQKAKNFANSLNDDASIEAWQRVLNALESQELTLFQHIKSSEQIKNKKLYFNEWASIQYVNSFNRRIRETDFKFLKKMKTIIKKNTEKTVSRLNSQLKPILRKTISRNPFLFQVLRKIVFLNKIIIPKIETFLNQIK